MVLPVENTSIVDRTEAWTMQKEEPSSDVQLVMVHHPDDELMSDVKQAGIEFGESVADGSDADGSGVVYQQTVGEAEDEDDADGSSEEERIELVSDDSLDDNASVCGLDDVESNEGMSEDLDVQEDLGLGGVSTHVAIEGELHVEVERVDLEKLKPKQEVSENAIAVVSEEAPVVDEAVHFAARDKGEEITTKKPKGCSAEQSDATDDCVDRELPSTKHEAEPVNGSANAPPPKNLTEESNVESDASIEEAFAPVAGNQADPNIVLEGVVDAPMPSPTRSPARACSLPIGREMAKSYSNLPTTPLFDSPAPDSSPIKWSKPSWTQVKLKPTEAGAAVKQGVSLQAPITHIREYIVSDHDGTQENGSMSSTQRPVAPALRRRASLPTGTSSGIGSPIRWDKPSWTKPQLRATKAGDLVKQGVSLEAPGSPIKSTEAGKVRQWEKPSWVQAKLRPTDKGAVVKTKGDLQKPITKAEKDVSHSFNHEANPMDLRPTEPGCDIRLGGTLAAPITPAKRNPMADVNFEANPEFILQPSETGQAVKQGTSLAKAVTHVNAVKSVARDVNPVANPAILRKTELGQIVKQVGDLQAPITHVERDTMKDINLEANPMILKPTEKGFKIRLGDNLSAPITDAPKLKNPMADINFEANPDLILHPTEQGQAVKHGTSLSKAITHVNVIKDASRDVNLVANPAVLRRTELGEIVKTKGDLQKPITHAEKDSLDDINFEANPMVLRPTAKGCLLRIGEDLARPITHINRNMMAEIDDFQQSMGDRTTESDSEN